MRQLTELDLNDKRILRANIFATRIDGSVGQTAIIVTFVPAAVPKFTESTFRGSLDDRYLLTIDDVVIDALTFAVDTQYKFEGG